MIYEVWAEGYRTNEGGAQATLMGRVPGTDFRQAVANLAAEDNRTYEHWDLGKLTFWGCRLFPTEAEARKSFG